MDFWFNLCHLIGKPEWSVFFTPSIESSEKTINELRDARKHLPILGEVHTEMGVLPHRNPNHKE